MLVGAHYPSSGRIERTSGRADVYAYAIVMSPCRTRDVDALRTCDDFERNTFASSPSFCRNLLRFDARGEISQFVSPGSGARSFSGSFTIFPNLKSPSLFRLWSQATLGRFWSEERMTSKGDDVASLRPFRHNNLHNFTETAAPLY